MVIIGSDGLWDGISLRGAAAIAARNHSTLETANRLIESALKFFGLFDDMTCVVMKRGNFKMPEGTLRRRMPKLKLRRRASAPEFRSKGSCEELDLGDDGDEVELADETDIESNSSMHSIKKRHEEARGIDGWSDSPSVKGNKHGFGRMFTIHSRRPGTAEREGE
uniref:PPM-type phosphatase domain-containing protein n=2 Tax=Chrysotila carterae TaxID=13221 RepID=A0A7S4EZA3_CHRCT